VFNHSLSLGLWSLESSSTAVLNSGVACLAETVFGTTPVVLRRHCTMVLVNLYLHYWGL